MGMQFSTPSATFIEYLILTVGWMLAKHVTLLIKCEIVNFVNRYKFSPAKIGFL